MVSQAANLGLPVDSPGKTASHLPHTTAEDLKPNQATPVPAASIASVGVEGAARTRFRRGGQAVRLRGPSAPALSLLKAPAFTPSVVCAPRSDLEDFVEDLKKDSALASRVVTLKDVEDGAFLLHQVGEAVASLKGECPPCGGVGGSLKPVSWGV